MPVREQTDARRKAAAAYKARQKESGVVAVTVRLDADTRAKLAQLAEHFGSKDAAVAALINAQQES